MKNISFSFKKIMPTAEEMRELLTEIKSINWDNMNEDSIFWFEPVSATANYNFIVHKGIIDNNEILLIVL